MRLWRQARQGLSPIGRLCPRRLYRRGEEGEHSEKERHLEHHREAACHRVGTRLVVECHRLLLAYHGILVAGIFLVDFLDIGGEDTHLCLSLVGSCR